MANYIERDGHLYRTVIGQSGRKSEVIVTDSRHGTLEDLEALQKFRQKKAKERLELLRVEKRPEVDWNAIAEAML